MTGTAIQQPLWPEPERLSFPPTRYQGSKRKLTSTILAHLPQQDFTTALDAFGGTGAVSHALKQAGKHVTYNDILRFNHQIGLALIENDSVRLTVKDVRSISARRPDVDYDDFIERTFRGVYFTDEENRWLDAACTNIPRLTCPYKRALGWYALFQAALAKRPYNLFHRRNLYMRLANVPRSFGNKASWDRPFDAHVQTFAREAGKAVINSGGACRALCQNAADVAGDFDLVYIDPPYISRNGTCVDYHRFYHFLEGMMNYGAWGRLIDKTYKHLPLKTTARPWNARTCMGEFDRLFDRFRHSLLAVSYRGDGIPSIEEITKRLRRHKRRVEASALCFYQYALSHARQAQEFLIVAR